MSDAPPLRRVLVTASLLAFTGGFVDVVGFVALFGLFTAHVTGNFVLIGAELVERSTSGVLGKLLALPVFVAAVAATRLAALAIERRGGRPLRPLLVAEALLLAAFMAAGLLAAPLADPEARIAIAAGLVGVAAMGVQNAGARVVLGAYPPTTIMTGNTTQFVIDLVDRLRGDPAARDAASARLQRIGPTLLAFVAGTTAGAIGFSYLSFWCLLAPIAAVALLASVTRAP